MGNKYYHYFVEGEDEIVRSCAIKQIKELTNSKTNSEFKHDVLRVSNLDKKLKDYGFSFDRFWSSVPKGKFKDICNSAEKIKK